MNVNATKGLFWVAALGVAGYLGFFIYDFLEKRPMLEKPLSPERQTKVLEDVQVFEQGERDIVTMARVKEVFGKDMDWTGTPPPPPPKVISKEEQEQEIPTVAVADMLKVLYTFAHDTDPTLSRVVEQGYEEGLVSFNTSLRQLIQKDLVELEVALAASDRPEELLLALRGYSKGRPRNTSANTPGRLRLAGNDE